MGAIKEEIASLLEAKVIVNIGGYVIESDMYLQDSDLVREDECYMRDYIWNDAGEVTQVNFDIIHVKEDHSYKKVKN